MSRKGHGLKKSRKQKSKGSAVSRQVLGQVAPNEIYNLNRTADLTHHSGASFYPGVDSTPDAVIMDKLAPEYQRASTKLADQQAIIGTHHTTLRTPSTAAVIPRPKGVQSIVDESYGGIDITVGGHNTAILADAAKLLYQRRPLHRHHLMGMLSQYQLIDMNSHSASWVSALELACECEWFNFGHIPNEDFVKEARKSVDLMGTGMIRAPYPICVYSHSTFTNAYYHSFYVVMDGGQDDPLDKDLGIDIKDGKYHIVELRAGMTESGRISFAVRIAVSTDYVRKGNDYTATVFANPLHLKGPDLHNEAVSAADPVAILTLALNTKNLIKHRVEPDAKLNKARERQKKPLLYPYTVVYMHEYLDAARETRRMVATGTHASPRPHLRRGHFRYKQHETIQPKWIEQCIVNAHKGPVLQREEYLVKK